MNEYIKNFGIPETLKEMDIPSLSKKIMAYGEETSYLPLQYKKMWFRHVHPLGCIKYAIFSNADHYVVVEAYVYADRNDENFIGIGRAVATDETVENTKFLTPIERYELLLATARGLAASKALADAGFGLQFYGDLIDPETANALSEKPDFESTPVMSSTTTTENPSVESTTVAEKVKRKIKEKNEETLPEEIKEEIPEDISEKIVNEPTTTATAPAPSTSTMLYEDACKVVVTIGPMKGKMLGDIITINPAYCAYMYGQKASITEEELHAVIAICKNNEIAKRRLLTSYPDALNE